MNEIVNKFLLACDKFMPEMHLRQPQFVYSACGPFTKNKESFLIKSHKEKGLLIIKKMCNQQMNFINQLLKNFIKEMCILYLKTIFGV